MNAYNILHLVLFIVVLIAVAIPLGHYMTSVLEGTSVVGAQKRWGGGAGWGL